MIMMMMTMKIKVTMKKKVMMELKVAMKIKDDLLKSLKLVIDLSEEENVESSSKTTGDGKSKRQDRTRGETRNEGSSETSSKSGRVAVAVAV